MNQEGWYSLIRGILFQTGIDGYGVFSMFNATNIHDNKSPLNIGQRKVTTSNFIG